VFGPGQFAPGTHTGQRLLVHELTHVLQQAGTDPTFRPQLEIGAPDDPAEAVADRVADQVLSDAPAPGPLHVPPAPPLLRRQPPTTPQVRGGPERLATLDQPPRGEDEVKVHIFRYLCSCRGRNVTRSSLRGQVVPRPAIIYNYCNGRWSVGLRGDLVPSGLTTGRATVTGDINVAPEGGSPGARVQVQGEARNTGQEPQVGGRAGVTVDLPRGPDISATGEYFRGLETGREETRVGVGTRIGPVTVGVEGTNLQDPSRRGATVTIGGPLGGPAVQPDICRVCVCPVVYDCLEDIPPRSYEEEVPQTVIDRTRLRYYFRLDTDQDARDPGLRRESKDMLDRLASLVGEGWTVASISGYASPEADEQSHNVPLSESRARRLHQLVAGRLGPAVALPEPEGRGELLGRIPTILPGSGLRDAIFSAGFSGPEEVTDFLFGDQIENDQLADQFLGLLNRITEREDRLRLFGVGADSPIKDQLLVAIDQFIARRGRGHRPWERVFEFLRFAAVEVTHPRTVMVKEPRRTTGSFTRLGEASCNRFAREAENQGLFGPAEAEPTLANCPLGEPRNLEEYASKCNYNR
jgi:hypothetical protein